MSALSRWLISAALGLAAFTTAAAGNAGDVYGLCPKEQPILDLGPIVALTRVELGPLVPGPGGNGVVQVAYHYHRTDDNQSLDEPFDLVLTELGAGIAHVLPAAPGATGSLGFKVRSFTWDDNDVLYLGTVGGQVPYGDERAHLLSFDYRDWTRRDIAALFPDGVDLQLQGVSRGSSYSVQSMWRGHDGAVSSQCQRSRPASCVPRVPTSTTVPFIASRVDSLPRTSSSSSYSVGASYRRLRLANSWTAGVSWWIRPTRGLTLWYSSFGLRSAPVDAVTLRISRPADTAWAPYTAVQSGAT